MTHNADYVSYLLQGGPFAIVIVLIILGKLGTNEERDRLRIENKELRDELKVVNENVRKEIVPPLTELLLYLPTIIRKIKGE